MADNVELNAGSGGAIIAADDIGPGVWHQRVKIQYGTDGSATDVSDTNPLPVDDAGGSLTVDNAALSVTGGGVEASALRVTIASDSTGVVSVDDGGGALTVDGAVSVTGAAAENAAVSGNPVLVGGRYDATPRTLGDGDVGAPALDADGAVQVSDGGNSLTVDNGGTFAVQVDGAALTALQLIDNVVATTDAAAGASPVGVPPLAVRDDSLSTLTPIEGDFVPLRVNSTGALHVTGGGGGTQYAVSDVAGATDTVTMAGVVRDDALSTLTEADGDVSRLRVNDSGALWVTALGAAIDDTTTNTSGTSEGSPIMAVATPTDGAVDANDFGMLAMSLDRRLHVDSQIVGQDANLTVDLGATDNAVLDAIAASVAGTLTVGSHAVTNAGTFAVQADNVVPGTGATNLGKAEDGAHTTGDVGVMSLAVRTDTPANRSGTDGDYEPLQVSAGRLWTSSTVTTVVPGTGATSLGKAEDAAHTTGDTGVFALALRTDTPASSAGTTGDYAALNTDATGRLWANIGAPTAGGVTPYRGIDVDETNEQVKASAGQVFFIHAMNMAATVRYLHFYDVATGGITVGTTTPTLTFAIPTLGDTLGSGFVLSIPNGIAFGTAICIAATTTLTGADAPGANEVIVNIGYA